MDGYYFGKSYLITKKRLMDKAFDFKNRLYMRFNNIPLENLKTKSGKKTLHHSFCYICQG